MSLTRRDLLRQTSCASLLASFTFSAACARLPGTSGKQSPYPVAARRREDMILRLGGLGDGYKMTWAADDRHYFGVNDGSGWLQPPRKFYNSHMWSVSGGPADAKFADVAGYPDLDKMTRPDDASSYYGHGTLAVDGKLYQFLSTLDRRTETPRHWTGAKLIQSADMGRTWKNQDNSAPVIWEDWAEQKRGLAFYDEPQGAFSLISVLQMGRDYVLNRDGYVYLYSPNGSVDGQMNELVMARVPKGRITDRAAYSFYAGELAGVPQWNRDIAARQPVHRFPRGWVNSTNLFEGDLVVEAWLPSVTFVDALGLYLMAASGTGCAPDGTEFGKPSYLGLWAATTPWGPWTQFHEETAWTPAYDGAARAYAPQIVPGWVAKDGKSFWLAWADLQGMRDFTRDRSLLGAELQKAKDVHERTAVIADFHRRKLPYYALNTQRVDLVLQDSVR
ncbi:MAG: hypothetical protein ABI395_00195 [Sphingobium sp.]